MDMSYRGADDHQQDFLGVELYNWLFSELHGDDDPDEDIQIALALIGRMYLQEDPVVVEYINSLAQHNPDATKLDKSGWRRWGPGVKSEIEDFIATLMVKGLIESSKPQHWA